MKKAKRKVNPVGPGKIYTDPELCAVFKWAPTVEHDPYWRERIFLVRLILGTGLRCQEALWLNLEDCGTDGVINIRDGKTDCSRRRVKCSPELLPYYRARLNYLHGTAMFPSVITTRTLETWWDDCFRAAGIPKIQKRCVHAGRHSFATWELASRRLTLTEVQAQLGHVDPSMTLGFYSHAVIELMYNNDKTPKWWAYAYPELKEANHGGIFGQAEGAS